MRELKLVRKGSHVSITQIPPMTASCKIPAESHHQKSHNQNGYHHKVKNKSFVTIWGWGRDREVEREWREGEDRGRIPIPIPCVMENNLKNF